MHTPHLPPSLSPLLSPPSLLTFTHTSTSLLILTLPSLPTFTLPTLSHSSPPSLSILPLPQPTPTPPSPVFHSLLQLIQQPRVEGQQAAYIAQDLPQHLIRYHRLLVGPVGRLDRLSEVLVKEGQALHKAVCVCVCVCECVDEGSNFCIYFLNSGDLSPYT